MTTIPPSPAPDSLPHVVCHDCGQPFAPAGGQTQCTACMLTAASLHQRAWQTDESLDRVYLSHQAVVAAWSVNRRPAVSPVTPLDAGLSPKHREAVRLRRDGRTIKQISEAVDMPEATLWDLFRRLRKTHPGVLPPARRRNS